MVIQTVATSGELRTYKERYTPKSVLKQMRYKSFTWEYNPGRCSYSCDRSTVKHKYPELASSELEDMDVDGAVITGTGEFFGPTAYEQWNLLVRVFREHGPGEFFHPIFTDVGMAILKKLDATVEPRENYVAYSFEFWQHDPPRIGITKIDTIPPTIATAVNSSQDSDSPTVSVYLTVGHTCDQVRVLQERLIADGISLPNYGADGDFGSETESAVRQYQSKHGLSVDGIVGSETASNIGYIYFKDVSCNESSISSGGQRTHTVVPGDCLWAIGNQYGVPWQDIATANGIKSADVIHPGQKLIIP